MRARARRRVYLYIELNIRYIIHFKFFLLACPENVCITRTLAAPAHSRSPSLFLSLFLPLSLPFTPFRPPFPPCPLLSFSFSGSFDSVSSLLSRSRSWTCAHAYRQLFYQYIYMYTLKRAPSKLTTAAARELTVITFSFFFFYFKDGSLSFAILCSTSIRLIYRYYTCNESARFCHNLYRRTSLRDPPYASLPDRHERATSGWSTPLSDDTIGDTRKLSLEFSHSVNRLPRVATIFR